MKQQTVTDDESEIVRADRDGHKETNRENTDWNEADATNRKGKR